MRNAGLDEAQPGIKIAGRLTSKIKHLCTSWKKKKRLPGEILITSDIQMTPPLCRKQRRTKEPLDESERGE